MPFLLTQIQQKLTKHHLTIVLPSHLSYFAKKLLLLLNLMCALSVCSHGSSSALLFKMKVMMGLKQSVCTTHPWKVLEVMTTALVVMLRPCSCGDFSAKLHRGRCTWIWLCLWTS
jgi:hypothetical protein